MKKLGNQFGIDLDGKYVIVKNDWIYKDFSDESETIQGTAIERVFYCRGGNGCSPITYGTLIGGYIIHNGYSLGIRGFGYMERLATVNEIEKAIALAKKNDINLDDIIG